MWESFFLGIIIGFVICIWVIGVVLYTRDKKLRRRVK
jgi:hypothetical protein